MITAQAPAKINLTLHITGQRSDGYHLLDSLVVFARSHDLISAKPSKTLSLDVTGPNAAGLSAGDDNLVMKAARHLQKAYHISTGAQLTLTKKLPFSAGIGSGSSDAAATIKALAQLWGIEVLDEALLCLSTLGADIPVCLRAPQPTRMQGIGERLSAAPQLPDFHMVLVNPRVDVPTQAVFSRLTHTQNTPMELPDQFNNLSSFIKWLKTQRNDLESPAHTIASDIRVILNLMNGHTATLWSGMSGSGATCVAITKTQQDAKQLAGALANSCPKHWWIEAAACL